MHRKILLLCGLALSPFVLAACTGLSSPGENNTGARSGDTSIVRTYLPKIDMSGRLSAQYEANYRDQTISVHFTWSQTPEQTLISLVSPTGQTVATILINARGAQLNEGDKPPRFASDINQLSTEVLGWPLPVAGLRDWLQGYVNADHAKLITSASASQTYAVDGWQLRYVSWDSSAQFERPKRLDLSRQTQQAGLVALRIVVDEWTAP